ncbi:pyridoxal-phosphate dependent enzyme [Rothia dentocariosa]|jgi:hypothetical protein|uniref:pyridoxal-phosphate dependent enzyme n=1 Tax=Rothia dentocariosa TaxID=2047 RepID=UPI00195A84F0|nr:pyridoxal-phosphate dependent enzyme [Rothia dentocariosa]VTY07425.1 putative siderophore biosynthesis protein SbnA [Rothia dentocariosa]
MPIVSRPEDFNVSDLFIDLYSVMEIPVLLKLEQFNFSGSIKMKTAKALIDEAEESRGLHQGDFIITSTSGNLGVALSIIAAARGYRFHCVTDSRCNPATVALMEAHGASVESVSTPHPTGGLLKTRLDRVAQLVSTTPGAIAIDQYHSDANPAVHQSKTGAEILEAIPDLSVIFVGVGTAGTAMGLARYLYLHAPHVKLIGIDSVGSVSFGGKPSPRHIPGLGSGVPPAQLDINKFDECLYVPEVETITNCRLMAQRGFLFGGSTGTVIAGVRRWLSEQVSLPEGRMVAIAPDGGERYLEKIYNDLWVSEHYL